MGVSEKFAARVVTDSEKPSAETMWQVWDEPSQPIADELEAYAALVAHPLPTSYTFPSGRVANLVSIGIADVNQESWDFRVEYSVFEPPEVDETEFEFEVGLQDVTITNALGTTSHTGGGRTAPDFSNGVNVSSDGKIQGVGVGQPNFSFSITKHWARSAITSTYWLAVKGLAGTYNNATFQGFAAGTIKFMGARGKPSGNKFPINYRFEFSENETGITIGDITGIDKLGWQYLDIYRRTVADATSKKRIELPHSVYVHTLPPGAGDFSILGL